MSWKTDLKLTDLQSDERLELTCLTCNTVYYARQFELLQKYSHFCHAYLDEVEKSLSCHARGCGGRVRLAMTYQQKLEGFVGGMA